MCRMSEIPTHSTTYYHTNTPTPYILDTAASLVDAISTLDQYMYKVCSDSACVGCQKSVYIVPHDTTPTFRHPTYLIQPLFSSFVDALFLSLSLSHTHPISVSLSVSFSLNISLPCARSMAPPSITPARWIRIYIYIYSVQCSACVGCQKSLHVVPHDTTHTFRHPTYLRHRFRCWLPIGQQLCICRVSEIPICCTT